MYSVYLLIKDGNPIYVGCTNNLHTRRKAHEKTKVFDSVVVLKMYKRKEDALIAENAMIRFISLFGGDEWVNGKHLELVYKGQYISNFKKGGK